MTGGREAAFIGLGSNLDDPAAQVRSAIDELGALPQSRLVSASSLYRTAPVGYIEQPPFINAVVRLDTALAPRTLLEALQRIERAHRRVRGAPNAPRTLDLDLLLYGEASIREAGLCVPHPRMHLRAFVLAPLAEIAPAAKIGTLGSAAGLLSTLPAQGVEKLGAD